MGGCDRRSAAMKALLVLAVALGMGGRCEGFRMLGGMATGGID